MTATVDLADIPLDVRKKLNLRKPARRGLSADAVRTAALRVLYVIADMKPSERARVLRQALKVNDV